MTELQELLAEIEDAKTETDVRKFQKRINKAHWRLRNIRKSIKGLDELNIDDRTTFVMAVDSLCDAFGIEGTNGAGIFK